MDRKVRRGRSGNSRKKRMWPHYAIVGGKPVKVVETPDGGLETLVLDMATGEFIRDAEYFLPATKPDGDADWPTKAEFDKFVFRLRVTRWWK